MRVGGNSLLGTVLAVAACGGGGAASQPAPVPSAEAAVRSFFQAVADSNIARMATLWGTEKGSAASTGQPPDYEKRLVVTQIYLRNAPFKLGKEQPVEGQPNRRRIEVELDRGQCKRQVPVVAVLAKDGWLVNQIDLNTAGSPTRPCAPLPETQP